MARYRNKGAGFTREDGSRWESGAIAEPTPRELAMRRHKLVPADDDGPASPASVADPLEGVSFASPDAESLARESGLTAASFEGRLGTGVGHAFTVADLRRLLEAHPDPLAKVDFASAQARSLARDEALTAADFEARSGSAAGEAFGVDDVRALLAEREE